MRCPLETYICLICKGNRLDVLGNLPPNLSLCKILQNWAVTASETEYRKAVMIHALQRVFLRLKTDFTSTTTTTFNFSKHNVFLNNQTANHSIRWLLTHILRWLQHLAKRCRFFLSSDLVASHLLLEESDINLWKTNNYCTQLHTFVTMSMAHDWRPCTWRVNADLEAWKLLGQVFDMVRSMDVNIFFLCCLLYFLFWGIWSRLSNFCLSHSWHGSLLSSWIVKGAAASLQFLGAVCLCQTPSEKFPDPEKLKSLCSHFPVLRMQGVQCLEQSLKRHGTQEIWAFSDGMLHDWSWFMIVSPCLSWTGALRIVWARLITQ